MKNQGVPRFLQLAVINHQSRSCPLANTNSAACHKRFIHAHIPEHPKPSICITHSPIPSQNMFSRYYQRTWISLSIRELFQERSLKDLRSWSQTGVCYSTDFLRISKLILSLWYTEHTRKRSVDVSYRNMDCRFRFEKDTSLGIMEDCYY